MIPFRFENDIISYSKMKRATLRTEYHSPEENPDDFFTVAIANFASDESVHADDWELHPLGDELLCVLEGGLEIFVDGLETVQAVSVSAGEAVIVPQGVWHRLSVLAPGRLLALTPRAHTELRPCYPPAERERHREVDSTASFCRGHGLDDRGLV